MSPLIVISWMHLALVTRLTTFTFEMVILFDDHMKPAIYYEEESWIYDAIRCYIPCFVCICVHLCIWWVIFFFFAESVMPSSGIFVVKLPNHPRNLGLTIKGDAFWKFFFSVRIIAILVFWNQNSFFFIDMMSHLKNKDTVKLRISN